MKKTLHASIRITYHEVGHDGSLIEVATPPGMLDRHEIIIGDDLEQVNKTVQRVTESIADEILSHYPGSHKERLTAISLPLDKLAIELNLSDVDVDNEGDSADGGANSQNN